MTARLVLVVLKDLRQDFENLLEDKVWGEVTEKRKMGLKRDTERKNQGKITMRRNFDPEQF